MTFRDDSDALLARLAALDDRVADFGRELAAKDAALAAAQERIAELEAIVARMQRQAGDREATIRDLERARGVDRDNPGDTRAEAERCLKAGFELYRQGDTDGARAQFERGLALVPDHPELRRAMRRYTS